MSGPDEPFLPLFVRLYLGSLLACVALAALAWLVPGRPVWAEACLRLLVYAAAWGCFLPPFLVGCLVVVQVVVGAPLLALEFVGRIFRFPLALLTRAFLPASPVQEASEELQVLLPERGVPFRYRFELGPTFFRLRWTHDLLERGGALALALGLALVGIALLWAIHLLPTQLRGQLGPQGGAPQPWRALLPGFGWSLGFALVGGLFLASLARRAFEVTLELEHQGPLRITRRPFLGAPALLEVDRSQVLDLQVLGDEHRAPFLGLLLREASPELQPLSRRPGEPPLALLTWLPPGAAPLVRYPLAEARPFLLALLAPQE